MPIASSSTHHKPAMYKAATYPNIHRLCLITFFILIPFFASAQTPRILWSFDTEDASFGQTAAADIDGDGKLELVFGCYRNDSCIYALNADDGSLLWKYNARVPNGGGCNDTAPIIMDVDGDGTLEVIVPSSCNPTTYCFDGRTGAVKWSAHTRGSDSPPTVAEIDGAMYILHGEFGGWVRCLNAADGSLAWELEVDPRSWIQTAPTLLDADGDGELDFVVATWNRTAGDVNTIRAYTLRDRALLWSTPLADVAYHGTAVVDLDRNGMLKLAIGDYSGTLTVLNANDGSIAWTMPSLGPGHYIGAPVSVGDLNGNGYCELVAVSWYKVLAFDREGRRLWEYDIDGYGTAFRGVVLADVDGDALPDVVFGTSKGQLVALSGLDGSLLWSVDLAADYGDARFGLDHAPVIADFTGDGNLDVFIVGGHTGYPDIEASFGRAYMLSIGRGEGPEWLMFQQNHRRDASLCRSVTNSADFPANDMLPEMRLYPHPVRDMLHVEQEGFYRCSIIDMAGQCVSSTGTVMHEVSMDVSGLPAGIYFLRVDGKGVPRIHAFIKQ